MELKTLKDIYILGDYSVMHVHGGTLTYPENVPEDHCPVAVNHDSGVVSFKIQTSGAVKEVGVNGCQADTLVMAAVRMLEGLNDQFSCNENTDAINFWKAGLARLEDRRKDRERRGVEGFNKQ